MARAISDPGMIALAWVDNKPVYFLSSQVSTKMTTIERREKTGEITIVPCPQLVFEYQRSMGGVDLHDQLRMQSYSIQLGNRFVSVCKYAHNFSDFVMFFFLDFKSIINLFFLVW